MLATIWCAVMMQLLTEQTHSIADVAIHPQQAGRRIVAQLLDQLSIDIYGHSLFKAVLPIHVHNTGLNATYAARRIVQPAAVHDNILRCLSQLRLSEVWQQQSSAERPGQCTVKLLPDLMPCMRQGQGTLCLKRGPH